MSKKIINHVISYSLIISLFCSNISIISSKKVDADTTSTISQNEYVISNPRIFDDSTTETSKKTVWDTVYYGSYPQTELANNDPEYINARTIPSSERDSYGDVIVGDSKYRFAEKSKATATGTGYSWDVGTHCFKYEPIKWRVLKIEDGKALLLSDEALDGKTFSTYSSTQPNQINNSVYLLSWLNGVDSYSNNNFIDCAFTDSEKEAISEKNVFLLNDTDLYNTEIATSYGFSTGRAIKDPARRCKPTDYAGAMGVQKSYGYCRWWTKSTNTNSYGVQYVVTVLPQGEVYTGGSTGDQTTGVRVAIELDLTKVSLNVGENLHTGEHHWIDYVITKKPTLEEPGIRTYHCEYGDTKQEEIPKLNSLNIEDYDINLNQSEYVYDKTEKKPLPIIDYLVENEDYELIYSNNINPGIGLLTIKGIGAFTGTIEKEFTIKKNIEYCNITLEYENVEYTGKELTPDVYVDNLEKGRDFEVVYVSNVKAGTAKIIINGLGEYGGSAIRRFTITSDDYTNYDYGPIKATGSVKNIVWTFYKDGTLTFEGNGEMPNYYYTSPYPNNLGNLTPLAYENPPWEKYYEKVRKIYFGEGITKIYCDFPRWDPTSGSQVALWNLSELNIEELILPNSLESIEDYAFENFHVKQVTIPPHVKKIGVDAFLNCSVEKITLNNELEIIDSLAFGDCTRLKEIILPDSLKEIGRYAFRNCASIKELNCPNNLNSIADYAFYHCEKLENVFFNNNIQSIGTGAFASCYSLKHISWPSTITTISEGAFSGCTNLEQATIPEGIERIDNGAFGNCSNLKEIIIPSTVKSIGAFAFDNTSSLKKVKLNEGLETIEQAAFRKSGFNYIRIPGSVKYIDERVFGSTDLEAISFENGYSNLKLNALFLEGDHINGYCKRIVYSTNFNEVETVLRGSTINCELFYDHIIGGNHDPYYYNNTFADELYHRAPYKQWFRIIEYKGVAYYTGSDYLVFTNSGGTYIINHGVCGDYTDYLITDKGELKIYGLETVYDYERKEDTPWYPYSDLITSVEIESDVTHIGKNAFNGLKNVTKVTIADSTTSIGENAFLDCESLTEITLSDNIKTLKNNIFSDTNNLTVNCSSGSNAHIYLTKNYNNIVINTLSGICGENLKWTITKAGTLNISGDGKMFNFERSEAPWYAYRNMIKKVIFDDGVTSIGKNAFFGCTKIESVEGTNSIEEVYENSFSNCINITELTFINATSIKSYAFEGCKRLKSLSLGTKLEELYISSLNYCTSLINVVLPTSLSDIYDAGKYSNNVTEFSIKEGDIAQEIFELYDIKFTLLGTETDGDAITAGGLHINKDISILGCQISSTMIDENGNQGGLRVVSQVEPQIHGKDVESFGYLIALNSYDDFYNDVLDDDISIDSTNEYVKCFTSTNNGILSKKMGSSDTATYYALTMSLGGLNRKALSATYKYRVFALLSDGTYVYSDVHTYSVESISKKIYEQCLMSTYLGHKFIYDHILNVIDPDYKEIDYNWNQTLVN